MIIKNLDIMKHLSVAKAYNCYTTFDGLNEDISTAPGPLDSYNWTSPLTYGVWIKSNSTGVTTQFFSKYDGGTGRGILCSTTGPLAGTPGRMRFQVSGATGSLAGVLDTFSNTSFLMPYDEWVHFAIVWDGWNGLQADQEDAHFYINGVTTGGNLASVISSGSVITTKPLIIGANPDIGRYSDASMQHAFFANTALSTATIKSIADQGRISPDYSGIPSITNYYKLDEYNPRDLVGSFDGTNRNMTIANIICE